MSPKIIIDPIKSDFQSITHLWILVYIKNFDIFFQECTEVRMIRCVSFVRKQDIRISSDHHDAWDVPSTSRQGIVQLLLKFSHLLSSLKFLPNFGTFLNKSSGINCIKIPSWTCIEAGEDDPGKFRNGQLDIKKWLFNWRVYWTW